MRQFLCVPTSHVTENKQRFFEVVVLLLLKLFVVPPFIYGSMYLVLVLFVQYLVPSLVLQSSLPS